MAVVEYSQAEVVEALTRMLLDNAPGTLSQEELILALTGVMHPVGYLRLVSQDFKQEPNRVSGRLRYEVIMLPTSRPWTGIMYA